MAEEGVRLDQTLNNNATFNKNHLRKKKTKKNTFKHQCNITPSTTTTTKPFKKKKKKKKRVRESVCVCVYVCVLGD